MMFEVKISDTIPQRDGNIGRMIILSKRLPDPTPGDVFDNLRVVSNAFGLVYRFDPGRYETSVDIPLLRTALLNLVDSSLQTRIIGGEK
jgi:hypothetical protein